MRKAWNTTKEFVNFIFLLIGFVIRIPSYLTGWVWGNISEGFLTGKEKAGEEI
jgi:hypothetical protein